MPVHGCLMCSTCGRACPICGTCSCVKTTSVYVKNDTLASIIERFKQKLEATDRERAIQEHYHNESSDYSTPPSMRVARLEGQVSMLKWVIGELEK